MSYGRTFPGGTCPTVGLAGFLKAIRKSNKKKQYGKKKKKKRKKIHQEEKMC